MPLGVPRLPYEDDQHFGDSSLDYARMTGLSQPDPKPDALMGSSSGQEENERLLGARNQVALQALALLTAFAATWLIILVLALWGASGSDAQSASRGWDGQGSLVTLLFLGLSSLPLFVLGGAVTAIVQNSHRILLRAVLVGFVPLLLLVAYFCLRVLTWSPF